MKEIAIIAAKRTAIGAFMGSLAPLKAHELGAQLARTLLREAKIDETAVDEVILGQVLTAAQGQNPARQTALAAGMPITTPAWTVNQVCGSGLKAIALGAQAIASGAANIVLAGGQESMSNAPHASYTRNAPALGDAALEDTILKDGLRDAMSGIHMGITAENLAEKYDISREQQDQFALTSQQRAAIAMEQGWFAEEIAPVEITTRKGSITVDTDEFPRPDTSLEGLAGLRPAFKKEGSVTAGNASGINDGAAMVLLMDKDQAEAEDREILGVIKAVGQAGVAPEIMGIGPVEASRKALKAASWTLDELDVIEANEAFAAQALAVGKELHWNAEKVNIGGGAIALGHPIGASGTRVLVTLLHHLKRTGGNKGLATLCIGGGMGIAMCVERV